VVAAGVIVASLVVAAAGYLYYSSSHGEVEALNMTARYTGFVVGVFGEIRNSTGEEVCVVGAELAEPAEGLKVEIHQTVKEGGAYKMIPVDKLCIPPGETLELRHGPGGYHIMIMPAKGAPEGALEAVVEDGYVDIRILLDNGEAIEVRVPVER
jgi:copper(I)-binding protein